MKANLKNTSNLPYFSRWYGSLYRKAQHYMRESFVDFDLAFTDIAILLFVCDNNGVSQEEIAQKMSFDRGAVTRSIKILEERGLVSRQVNPNDNRMKFVKITPKAQEYAQTMGAVMDVWHQKLMQTLTEEEVKHLLSGLQKMAEVAANLDIAEFLASNECKL